MTGGFRNNKDYKTGGDCNKVAGHNKPRCQHQRQSQLWLMDHRKSEQQSLQEQLRKEEVS